MSNSVRMFGTVGKLSQSVIGFDNGTTPTDADLIASNIKKDINILGITGTYYDRLVNIFTGMTFSNSSRTTAPYGTVSIGSNITCNLAYDSTADWRYAQAETALVDITPYSSIFVDFDVVYTSGSNSGANVGVQNALGDLGLVASTSNPSNASVTRKWAVIDVSSLTGSKSICVKASALQGAIYIRVYSMFGLLA